MRQFLIDFLATLSANILMAFIYGVVGILIAMTWGVPWSWTLLWKIGISFWAVIWLLDITAPKLRQ